jgi:hypothetical protein
MSFISRAKKGPFEANRILDTHQSKIDQVFTREDEKPVALFIHTTEDEAKKIGAEGYIGPTNVGAKGEYEKSQKWVTKAIYFPENIPGAISIHSGEIFSAVSDGPGTLIPRNITITEVKNETTIPISGSAFLRTNYRGETQISGYLALSGPISTSKQLIEERKDEDK